ncbi:MAG: hypothetical protein C4297_05595 [Gemmataceae bacterium]
MTPKWLLLMAAIFVGGMAAGWYISSGERAAYAASTDRYGDYAIATGPVLAGVTGGADLDGVWLLDYRAGKLLATVINRSTGKVLTWAEMDLVQEFGLQPRQDVHFIMATGNVGRGQSALYVAEINSGKFAVYSMGIAEGPGLAGGIFIRRHDLVYFRAPAPRAAAEKQPEKK